MFTSSAEHRLMLRHDNADIRLQHFGFEVGLLDAETFSFGNRKQALIEAMNQLCLKTKIHPSEANILLSELGYPAVTAPQSAMSLLKRPGVHLATLLEASPSFKQNVEAITLDVLVYEQVEIDIKYEGYLKRDILMAEKILRLDQHQIPASFKYENVSGLSNEGREKLKKHQPDTIGQASRILGVSPSDISILMIRIGR